MSFFFPHFLTYLARPHSEFMISTNCKDEKVLAKGMDANTENFGACILSPSVEYKQGVKFTSAIQYLNRHHNGGTCMQ